MGKKKEKKEKKAGKRMTKKELVKALLDFFHQKQGEVLPLKYIFDQLHLTTHPLKMLCMDVLHELQDDDYINETEKNKYKLNLHGVEMTGIFQRKSNASMPNAVDAAPRVRSSRYWSGPTTPLWARSK